jgi:glycosyltransferase involved in cell wall biosynthesis
VVLINQEPSQMTTTTPFAATEQRAAGALSGLTIVLPAYDEAENLPDAVRYATEAAERCAVEHEIVIVDDGSSDQTTAVAGELAAADPRVRLIVHAENRGYGEALRSGIAAARMPWILLIDADLQYDFADLEAFLAPAPSADLIVGWRILRQGTPRQRLSAAMWSRFVVGTFRLVVRDVDCGFRLGRRELLQSLELRASGALVGAEILVKARSAGARMFELPVHHRARVAGRSAGPGPRFFGGTLREVAHLRRALHQNPIPPFG